MIVCEQIFDCIDRLMDIGSEVILIGIDGRSGAGKTTLCENLLSRYDCNVFHMDDFFLRSEQRSKERMSLPGENIDHERILSEVILPLKEKREVIYKKYNCHTQNFEESLKIQPRKLNIIEGAYSFHPDLIEHYDYTIFLDVDANTQMSRILKRNGHDMAEKFFNVWIPLEELYIKELDIINKSDLVITL